MKIDKQLQLYCKERGLTITALAKLSGVSTQTLHNWSIGKPATNFEYARIIADVLRVPLYELVFGLEDPHSKTRGSDISNLLSGEVRLAVLRADKDSMTIRIDRTKNP